MKNALEWLENTVSLFGDKPIYCDENSSVSFEEVFDKARRIGTALDKKLWTKAPVAVFMDRCAKTSIGFAGVVYSGRAYAPIDSNLPKQRIKKILEILNPEVVLTEDKLKDKVSDYTTDKEILTYEELTKYDIDEQRLAEIRRQMVATDPLYLIFTSGSSGNPKGVITSHESLITYINAYSKVMEIDKTDRLGNQSPLDYIAAIRDIYLPMKTGCSTYIIPKEYFMEPENLFKFMNDNEITAVGWSVSAFTIANSLGAFEESKLNTLKKICFSGSVMPGKCIRKWQENLKDAKFVNQYGPTETTASCTYYVLDHLIEEDEVIPIGKAYDGYRVFLLDEDNNEVLEGIEGEICVSGPALALGYYNDYQRTSEAFVQNPLTKGYYERMYRTGDIGIYLPDGNLEFHGRKDRQIKHMGHRVELDEVEYAANMIDGVSESCCIYIKEKEKLILFYTGDISKRDVVIGLRDVLPGFMVPRKVIQLENLIKLPNGKIDYTKMKESLK